MAGPRVILESDPNMSPALDGQGRHARGDDVELDGADALDRVDEEPRAAAAACGADGRQVEPIPVPEAVFRVIA